VGKKVRDEVSAATHTSLLGSGFPLPKVLYFKLMMSEDYFLSKKVKIKVPHTAGSGTDRIMTSLPFLSIFAFYENEYIIIENGILTYVGSIVSGRPRKSFQLKDFDRLLLQKKEVSSSNKEENLFIYVAVVLLPIVRLGTEIELSLIDKAGKHHVLIPRFLINNAAPFNTRRLQKEWDSFLKELCRYSGLPLEEMSLS
jgi:hypothetical protein